MNVLITGGTGSLGSLLVEHFVAQGDVVTVLSRDAHKQATLLAKFPNVKFILGDIRDIYAVERAAHNQDIVINAAAHKRIERGETDAQEYISVNTLGAENVVRSAYYAGAQKCLLISSDKAPAASSVYGATKYLAEHVFLSYPIGSALRYGNVMDSQGAVWWVWLDALHNGRLLNIRKPYPTRFFLLRKQAVALVQDAITHMQGGEVFIPRDLHAVDLHAIAKVLVPDMCWLESALQPGEKQHEVLIGAQEHYAGGRGKLLGVVKAGVAERTEIERAYCSQYAPRLSGTDAVMQLLQATNVTLPESVMRNI